MSSLRNILLLVKDPVKTSLFFRETLNLKIVTQTDAFIELKSEKLPLFSVPIIIREAVSAAHLASGYSPFLNFDVSDLDRAVTCALSHGAILDGPIKYPAHGKFAAIRSPDGFMIGLFQPAIAADIQVE